MNGSFAQKTPGSRALRGFTLIELLIANALGFLLIAAVTSSFISARQTFGTTRAMSSMQEQGRFAMTYMAAVIREAGYLPDPRRQMYPNAIFSLASERPAIFGWNNAAPNLGALANARNNMDAIAVTYSGNADNNRFSCLGQSNGDFLATEMAVNVLYLSTPPNNGNLAGSIGDLSCAVRFFKNCGESMLTCQPDGGWTHQALVRGVVDMQMLYGLDTDEDYDTDRWATASGVADWTQVTAVQIDLIIDSDARSEAAGLGSEAGVEDKRVRRTFTNTIAIRNRLLN